MTTVPPRGFPQTEFETRTQRAQRMMRVLEVDALLLTTEPLVRYFTGFLTQFWMSPTRPWFLLVPLDGKPVAVIPTIGEVGMRETWLDDIRCWSSPCPQDDGVSLLSGSIANLPRRFGRVGVPVGAETHLRMPAADFEHLRQCLNHMEIVDCGPLLARLCGIKSALEIEKISYICGLATDSFHSLPGFARSGDRERDVVRNMRIDLLQRGADNSSYIVCASGPDGYDNIIMGPTDRRLRDGDLLIVDTGTTYDGYYCDFDRNFAFCYASEQSHRVYQTVYQATDAGLAVARAGATTADIWRAMWSVLQAGGAEGNDVGRMGHGLGAQLTEWPSITAIDTTVLKPGMVITLEPGMRYDGNKQMVHEENILITEDEPMMLSGRAPPELTIIA